MRFYDIPPEKITVIHHGVNDRLAPANSSDQQRVRAKYELPERFVLAVGTIQPRKNLPRLAEAIAELRGRFPELALVVAGKRGWMAGSVVDAIHHALPPGVFRELGYVPSDDVPALYSAASATALVSTYEGFGLPVLEAFRCGAPLLISQTPALIEVAGTAALSAPAESVTAIAAQLATVLQNPDFAAQLRMRGLARSADFTWRKTAQKTMDVLDSVTHH
jgi:glycosyltransferase involved in cell wall biosynthesis